jgi:hypothetical protein
VNYSISFYLKVALGVVADTCKRLMPGERSGCPAPNFYRLGQRHEVQKRYLRLYPNNMALRQTISFFDKLSKQVISIQVAESSQLPQSAGYWNTDTNQILLGAERFSEWETLTGHLEKQIEFIFSLQKVTRPGLD